MAQPDDTVLIMLQKSVVALNGNTPVVGLLLRFLRIILHAPAQQLAIGAFAGLILVAVTAIFVERIAGPVRTNGRQIGIRDG